MEYPNRNVRRSVKKASDELGRLSVEVERTQNRSPPADATLLDRILPHFDEARIPTSAHWSIAEQEAIELALSSMRLFGSLMSLGNDELFRKAAMLWPKFWKWAEWALWTYVDRPPAWMNGYPPSATETLRIIGRPLAICSQNSIDMRTLMARTQGFCEVLTYLWLQEEIHEGIEKLNMISNILGWVISVDYDLSEVLYVANGPKSLARIAIRHLRAQLDKPVLHLDQLHSRLLVVSHLMEADHSQVHAWVLRYGLVPEAIRCLGLIQRQSLRSGTVIHALTSYCLDIIRRACTYDGLFYAMQALRRRLLPIVLGCARILKGIHNYDPVKAKMCLAIFDEAIGPYLIYPSVVRCVAREADSCPDASTVVEPMKSAWIAFKDIAERRKIMCDIQDEKGVRACAHCKMSGSDSEGPLRQCAGCQGPRYCSKQCQRKAWPQHREECLAHWQAFYDPDLSALSLTGFHKAFLKEVVIAEALRNRDTLNHTLATEYAGVSLKYLVLKWNTADSASTAVDIQRDDTLSESEITQLDALPATVTTVRTVLSIRQKLKHPSGSTLIINAALPVEALKLEQPE